MMHLEKLDDSYNGCSHNHCKETASMTMNLDFSHFSGFQQGSELSAVHSDSSASNLVYVRRKQYGVTSGIFSVQAPTKDKSGEACKESSSPDFVYRRTKHKKNSNASILVRGQESKETDREELPERSRPHLVYRRRKLQRHSVPFPSDNAPKSSKRSKMDCAQTLPLNFVYRRRKLLGVSAVNVPSYSLASTIRSGNDSLSVSSDSPPVAAKNQLVGSEGRVFGVPLLCDREALVSHSPSHNACSFLEDLVPSKSSRQKIISTESMHDSCSSKANMDLESAAVKAEVDDNGECSSTSAMVVEAIGEDMSEKDVCISILRSHGVFGEVRVSCTDTSSEGLDERGRTNISRSCKICSQTDSAQKMLICDNCEEAFHLSCCNFHVKRMPEVDWFCDSCSKKKHKLLEDSISRRSANIIVPRDRCKNSSSTSGSNPIMLMLRNNEPYTTGVRIGKGFQANVPEWSGPINHDVNRQDEPLQLDPAEFVCLHEFKSSKPLKIGYISNWLQCRGIVNDAECGSVGTICGKWRRAPLLETQSNDWECFCSILWDAAYADCAVLQEVETGQVLEQLKYMELLRPRLAAQKRKADTNKKQ